VTTSLQGAATGGRRDERGSGTLSTVFGVGVFLILLMFCAHLLLNLWLMSSVDAVAHDAATDVASSGAGDAELPSVQAQAIERARAHLGEYGDRVRMAFEPGAADQVVLHVVAPELTLLPRAVADLAGIGGLDRRIVVHRERPDEERR